MAKTIPQALFIRLDSKEKQALLKAAEEAGLSLSHFVLQAALAKAGLLKEESTSDPAFSWKRELESAAVPGSAGYFRLGRILGRNLRPALLLKLQPKELDPLIGKIETALSHRHLNQVWAFLNSAFPEALRRIPSRRRQDFLEGLAEAFDRDELF